MEKKSAGRDPKKEQYWRGNIERWHKSGLSQMQFCEKEGLNHHTFASWVYIIRDRDNNKNNKKVAKPRATRVPKVLATVPTFARVEIAEQDSPGALGPGKIHDAAGHGVAAELINAETGCRLRIFNGANQATLAAVLSAWSGH